MSDDATLPIGLGEILAGKYRVERVIGAGGMGVVVEATHLALDQRVAIKYLREAGLRDPEALARFSREARAAVKLRGEHVARVIDVGAFENGSPYFVMDLLEGVDLGHLLSERGPLPLEEAVVYVLHACEALAEAHALGIVHRDLKPRNLFVTKGVDGKPLLKVLDFGIAKWTSLTTSSDNLALTKTSDVMGSPMYMSPEQLRSAKDADARSDVWSLGVILYELVTARMPFEAQSVSELAAMVLRDQPKAPSELRAGLPRPLDDVILRCLAKDPKDRFASVAELAKALEPFGREQGKASRVQSIADANNSSPSIDAKVPQPRPSAGTFVSWGESEPAKQGRSRALAIVAAASLGVSVAAAAGFLYSRETRVPAPASPPNLPETRKGLAPLPAPEPSASAPAAEASSAAPTSSLSIANIPRKPASVPRGGGATGSPRASAGPAATAFSAKKPDPHDLAPVGRK